MIVLITGAPGAGKGTQADLIAERKGYRKLSTGDALRAQVKLKTEIGKKAEKIMEAGKLVPDDVLLEILKQELGSDKDEVILLDGYPRNLNQAKSLEKIANVHPVKCVIHLDVNKNELIRRLSGRRICAECGRSYHVLYNPPKQQDKCDLCKGKLIQRPDDTEEKAVIRLDVYENDTKPVLDYYRQKSLYFKVDGSDNQEDVFSQITKLIPR